MSLSHIILLNFSFRLPFFAFYFLGAFSNFYQIQSNRNSSVLSCQSVDGFLFEILSNQYCYVRTKGREKFQLRFFPPELYRGLSILLHHRSTCTRCRHLGWRHQHPSSLRTKILKNRIIILILTYQWGKSCCWEPRPLPRRQFWVVERLWSSWSHQGSRSR